MVDLFLVKLLLCLAAILYVFAGGMLYRMARGWLRRRMAGARGEESAPPPAVRWARAGRIVRAAVLSLAALGIVCAVYARLVEPFWPKVERVEIRTAELPAGARPVRLVLLSDFHCDPQRRLEPRLPGMVAELRPDAIVFAGDAVNSEESTEVFRELISRLARIAPTCAVRGNWETWWFPQIDLYGGTGAKLLEGDVVRLAVGGSEIWLAGVGVDRESSIPETLAKVPQESFAVFVHHFPEAAAEAVRAGADLALAGDTHGGQVRLPFIGPTGRISRWGGYHDVGLHRIAGGWLYVSRGIGMEGGTAPRVRFLCRPEITLIEIVPESKTTEGL